MTRFITFIGVVGIAVSSLVNVLLSTSEDSYLIPESIVALSILLTAHKFSQILIDYQKGEKWRSGRRLSGAIANEGVVKLWPEDGHLWLYSL